MAPTKQTEESKQAEPGENRAGERSRGRFWRAMVRKCLKILVFGLLMAGLLSVGLYLSAPVILKKTAPAIAQLFGVHNVSFKVKKLSFSTVELTDIQLGDGAKQGIIIERLHIRRSGKRGQADSVDISGLTITGIARDGRLFIPGIVQRVGNPGESPSISTAFIDSLRLPETLGLFDFPLTITISRSAATVMEVFPGGNTKCVVFPFEARVFLEKPGTGTVTFQGEAAPGDGHLPFLPIEASRGHLTYSLSGVFSAEKPGVEIELTCDVTNIVYNRENEAVSIPRLALAARVNEGENGALDGSASLACVAASARRGDMTLQGITLNLPLKFQLTDKLVFTGARGKGALSVAAVNQGGRLIGALAADIVQAEETLAIVGHFNPAAGKKVPPVNISASMTLPGGKENPVPSWRADIAWQPEKVDCGEFVPAAKGVIISGSVKITAVSAEIEKSGESGSVEVTMSEGRLAHPATNTVLAGLDISFTVPDLGTLRSAPAQPFHCQSLTCGNISLTNGDIRFQLEPGNILFIESGTLEWCDGKMDLGAMRFDPGHADNIRFTAFCDRLKLAELLSQLKVAQASGNGRVGGRLPIRLAKGKVEIDQGFLYSTPGEGGRVQLKQFASTGLEDTIQMAIAREALKDYQYKWLRMALNTQGEELTINLKMDGAPTGKLAFSYDEKTALKKAGAGDPGALFQGISFDINFAIPINEVIYLGGKAGELF